ncbi:Gram positive anchor./von Willebrand factor type A domain [Butyrivibrio fibrisolvens 16/4]|nr:Gram positive anchor./von Willebrand factor type A domain [Butyrivibrio fibrisolvens 16/4]
MTETHGDKTRIQLLKSAVDNMIDNIAEKEDVDAKWEVIDFATRAAVRGGGWLNTSNVKQYVTTAINEDNNVDIGRGTNYQAGMDLAQKEFEKKQPESDRPNAKKIVLFLTDGQPTYYGSGVGNDLHGNGSYFTSQIENASYTAAENLKCDYFYAIGIGLESVRYYTYRNGRYTATNNYIEGETILNNLKNHNTAPADHKAAYNIDITDVSNTLEGLAGVISTIHTGATVPGEPVKAYANNVVMVDKLSSNVKFTPNSIFYINVSKDGQSLTNDASYWTDGRIDENGVMSEKATYTIPDGSGVKLEAEIQGDKVILDFPNDYYLDKGYEYSVKFKIEPTDSAYEYYFNNQTYPDVGDDLTDHYNNDTGEERPEDEGEEISTNQISSLKPGFYTNDSSENGKYARTTFTFLGVDGEEELFPKPVVPVHFKNSWEIYKTDENGEAGQRLSNAAFEMIKVDTNATYTTGSSTNQEGQEGLIIWNKDEIEPNAEYVIKETATPLGYINTGEYWKIALDEENVPTITPYDADGTAHETIVVQPQLKNRNEVTYTFYYKNFKKGEAYVLPQTGGRGIYVTTVGGIMMMLTSVFLFYRNRKRLEYTVSKWFIE